MHELSPLIAALTDHRPYRARWRRHAQRAAVAVILRESRQGAEVLLVERAWRAGDPWSGDMALPGGKIDAADAASASRAACRETAEEIGLALSRDHGIGRLSDQITLDHRRRRLMTVSPFVYRLPEKKTALVLNHEILTTHWLALAWLDEPTHRGRLAWRIGPLTLPMPCYDLGGERRLWGLTLRILIELSRLAAAG